MSRERRKPTKEEETLKAICIVAINNQLTVRQICDELLRQHLVIKEYLTKEEKK